MNCFDINNTRTSPEEPLPSPENALYILNQGGFSILERLARSRVAQSAEGLIISRNLRWWVIGDSVCPMKHGPYRDHPVGWACGRWSFLRSRRTFGVEEVEYISIYFIHLAFFYFIQTRDQSLGSIIYVVRSSMNYVGK